MISAMFSLDKEGKYVEKSSVLNKWIDRMAVRGGWRTSIVTFYNCLVREIVFLLGFRLLTLSLGQICVANHSWLYRHIRSPLPTMSVIHMNTFHTCDTFPCFFGFKNTNDTETARVKNSHKWRVIVTKYVAIIVTQRFERALREDSNNANKGCIKTGIRCKKLPESLLACLPTCLPAGLTAGLTDYPTDRASDFSPPN